MKKIACMLADGFEETEALATVDILRRAGLKVDLVSIDKEIVRGSHDIKVVSDRLVGEDLIDYDMIFLPGGLPGATNLMADQRVLDLLRQFDKKGKWIAAICAAPSVLAAAGIIKDRKLTSYPVSAGDKTYDGAEYLEDLVVIDGNLVTSRGVATVPEFAFTLVNLLDGDASKLHKAMLFNLLD
ncbi:MAG: DJ-1/PfpI family protein [Erysipelotrichaceae bacterium]|nr:DJ-1/PfpI family protein [Erysipelotrichaceae bacterium]